MFGLSVSNSSSQIPNLKELEAVSSDKMMMKRNKARGNSMASTDPSATDSTMDPSVSASSSTCFCRRKKQVRFVPWPSSFVTYHEIQKIPKEYKCDCYYTTKELKEHYRLEIAAPNTTTTQRRREKHAFAVVTIWRGQRARFDFDDDALRTFARARSRQDRHSAIARGIADSKEVGYTTKSSGTLTPKDLVRLTLTSATSFLVNKKL